jgi:DNA-binding NtrC family response regulator
VGKADEEEGNAMQGRTRVLAVDDDRLIRLNLSLLLGREGLEVDTAATCREARTLLDRRPYGVVVTDLDLPDASGLEVVKWARENCPDTKIILISGSSTALEGLAALDQEAAKAVVLKPFRFDELLALVRDALPKSDA